VSCLRLLDHDLEMVTQLDWLPGATSITRTARFLTRTSPRSACPSSLTVVSKLSFTRFGISPWRPTVTLAASTSAVAQLNLTSAMDMCYRPGP